MTKIRKKDLHFTLMRLRDRVNRKCVVEFENTQEIQKINRTLKNHGEAHMAQDLTPQFTKLCEKVDDMHTDVSALKVWANPAETGKRFATLEERQNLTRDHIKDYEGKLGLDRKISEEHGRRISGLRDRMDVLEAQGPHTCHNLPALQEDRKRIIELETHQTQLNASENIARICERLNELEEDRKKLFPHTHTTLEDKVLALEKKYAREPLDRAILTQHSNRLQILEEANAAYWEKIQAFDANMKEQRSDYHDRIRQLVTENEAAHFEMKNLIDRVVEITAPHSLRIAQLEQANSAARESNNAQAAEILKMQEQIKGLENRLSRAQDLIAECHPDGYVGMVQSQNPVPLLSLKTPLPLKGRPAAKKPAKKVQA